MIYGIISDTHCHAWSAFSTTDEFGVNSRLRIILAEMRRAAETIKAAGGNRLVHAGDLFHVRDSLSPSVLNPTLETIDAIIQMGVQVDIIAGNHDLGTRHSTWNSNASSALSHLGATVVADAPMLHDGILFVPWVDQIKKLRQMLVDLSAKHPGVDVVLHAPLNGVIKGIPDIGLDPSQLGLLGFRRVFCGHYHDHKGYFDSVFSVGSLTHQTWSDVGTRSGFLIVDDTSVQHVPDQAPKFMDYDGKNKAAMAGNYVRAKAGVKHHADADRYREAIMSLGALGVVIHPLLKDTSRKGATVKSGASIQQSIADWVSANKAGCDPALLALCGAILDDAA